mmetsp:Transcript_84251/g.243519  ORF Transcript_84251/g.243519 Transcript_84251/m.243519 type:complete len:222 (+) Transcript_84251:678-1343(+)
MAVSTGLRPVPTPVLSAQPTRQGASESEECPPLEVLGLGPDGSDEADAKSALRGPWPKSSLAAIMPRSVRQYCKTSSRLPAVRRIAAWLGACHSEHDPFRRGGVVGVQQKMVIPSIMGKFHTVDDEVVGASTAVEVAVLPQLLKGGRHASDGLRRADPEQDGEEGGDVEQVRRVWVSRQLNALYLSGEQLVVQRSHLRRDLAQVQCVRLFAERYRLPVAGQ